MTPLNLELGLSESTAQAGESGRGNFVVTGGGSGGLSSLLPKVSTDKAWIVWVAIAMVAGAVVIGIFKFRRRK